MNRVANKDCRLYVTQRKPFQGSNLFAQWNDGVYVVYSYGHHFPMYVYDPKVDQWFANEDKYSRSTTRHQSQARPHYDNALHWLTTDAIKRVVYGGFNSLAKGRVLHG